MPSEPVDVIAEALEGLLDWASVMPGYHQAGAVKKAQDALNARCCRLHGSHGQHEPGCALSTYPARPCTEHPDREAIAVKAFCAGCVARFEEILAENAAREWDGVE